MENQNHVHVYEDIVIPPTCHATGHTLHRCACGHEYKDNYVPMTAHKYAVTEQTVPTCTQPGIQQLRCEICGDEKTQPLPALGHDWSQWNTQATPSCVTDGKQTRVCTRCGKVGERSIPATGHKLGKGQKSKAKRGYVKYTCEICGQTVEKKSASRKAVKWIVLASVLALLVVVVLGVLPFLKPFYHYKAAELHMENEEYADAYYHLLDCEEGLLKLHKNKISKQDLLKLKQRKAGELNPLTYLQPEIGNQNITPLLKDKLMDEYVAVLDLLEDFVVISTATNYDADGVISGTTTAKYNQDKNTITYIDRDAYGEAHWKFVHTYDKDGNEISYAYYGADGYSYTYEYAYDKNGNRASETCYDADGEVTRKTEYTYDKNGNQTSYVYYNADGEETGKGKRSYDKNGNMTSEAFYRTNNDYYADSDYYTDSEELYWKNEYTYDKNGNMTSFTSYDSSIGLFKKVKCTYNKDGVLTGCTTYNADGNVDGKAKYTYDKNGNMTSFTYYDADGEVDLKEEYTYDKDGNCTSFTDYDSYEGNTYRTEYHDFEVIYLAANSR